MFNVQGSEMVFLVLIALLVLGPEKLPDAIRKFGRLYAEFRKVANGFQGELRSALDEPMREIQKTADLVRGAATFEQPAATPAATPPVKPAGVVSPHTQVMTPPVPTTPAAETASADRPPLNFGNFGPSRAADVSDTADTAGTADAAGSATDEGTPA